jgi:4-hydroxybenzoate polyprenyltransferase
VNAAGVTLNKTRVFAEMIKWEHSIFALPFAYIGAALAVPRGWPSWGQIGWITLAMVAGRSLAFVLNRGIDSEIDARNPRTADRAVPRGLLSTPEVIAFSAASLGLFMLAVFELAPIVRPLSPIVIAMFVVYPYTKRFTWLSHFWLGASLGLAPVGAWVAITGRLDWQPWIFFVAVTLWVAGFDVIYATQDLEVDCRDGLKSIPACFGVPAALTLTRVLHAASFALLLAAGAVLHLGPVYYLGVLVTGALLAYENLIVSPGDLSRLDAAFFTMNGVISVVTLAFTLADKIVRG